MDTDKKELSFRELLEKNTNLLTILAILNALSLCSQSFVSSTKGIGRLISFLFLLLSMIVFMEVIEGFWIDVEKSVILTTFRRNYSFLQITYYQSIKNQIRWSIVSGLCMSMAPFFPALTLKKLF